jgi:hypothetical protein
VSFTLNENVGVLLVAAFPLITSDGPRLVGVSGLVFIKVKLVLFPELLLPVPLKTIGRAFTLLPSLTSK